ncbi:polysaccharide deacetylase family protein [Ramlibacter sp. AN1015]|uniref:polysaccharide deacetylase family protein n=1 Tax=Ramlibacter sp. AN1015 TaxID=3133428 RepID=UPI0030BB2535
MSAPHSSSRRPPIPILSYHQTDMVPPRGTPHRELVLPPARFARQMRALARIGWRGLSMRDLEPYLRGEKVGKVVGITLDDGFLNNYHHALPVLRELGFTATSFVVSQQIGGHNEWDRPAGVEVKPLMDLQHLREWMDAGMEIGAHTRNHADLLTCSEAQAVDEIAGSRHELEALLQVQVRSFCFPYGRLRDEHVEIARAAGYATAATSDNWRVGADADLLRLPRISVWLSTPLPLLLAKVATGYEEWRHNPILRAMLGRKPVKTAALAHPPVREPIS